jgi:CHRD domain
MAKVRASGTILIALIALSVIAAPATVANGRPLKAELTGANEVPGPGDPDGSGVARLRLNQGRHRICYRISVADIALPVTAAHIHEGAEGVAGPPVVTFGAFVDGTADGCVTVPRAIVKAIRKNRSDYYVNVHNDEFPDGAIRGQLTKLAPGRR